MASTYSENVSKIISMGHHFAAEHISEIEQQDLPTICFVPLLHETHMMSKKPPSPPSSSTASSANPSKGQPPTSSNKHYQRQTPTPSASPSPRSAKKRKHEIEVYDEQAHEPPHDRRQRIRRHKDMYAAMQAAYWRAERERERERESDRHYRHEDSTHERGEEEAGGQMQEGRLLFEAY